MDGGEFLREARVERKDDFMDDEFDTTQMQNGLSTIVEKIPEMNQLAGAYTTAAGADKEKPEKEKPTPEQALLNCIQKVYAKNLKSKTQIAMQRFVIDFLGPKKVVAGGARFMERRAELQAAEREAEERFWNMYHVDVKKADSYHEKLLSKKWPKWRTHMKEVSHTQRHQPHTIHGLKSERVDERTMPPNPHDLTGPPGTREFPGGGGPAGRWGGLVGLAPAVPVGPRGASGGPSRRCDEGGGGLAAGVERGRTAGLERLVCVGKQAVAGPDFLLRAFGLPEMKDQHSQEQHDMVSGEKILYQRHGVAEDPFGSPQLSVDFGGGLSLHGQAVDGYMDAENVRRKKEFNAYFRRSQKLSDAEYLKRMPQSRFSSQRPGLSKKTLPLNAQQVSNLSVATYFRSCENLGTVPKVPKSIVLDRKNDEEGVLATSVNLEGLDMSDKDLIAYEKAIFSEVPVLMEKSSSSTGVGGGPGGGASAGGSKGADAAGSAESGKTSARGGKNKEPPGRDDVLALLPATKIKHLRLGQNRFTDKGIAKFLAGFNQKRQIFELEEINLQGLSQFSSLSINKLSSMLGEPQAFPRILQLNLSGISTLFTQREQSRMLCDSLVKVGSLQDLNVADTGLGLVSQQTVVMFMQAVSDLLGVRKLDLSSNYISKDGFVALGKYIEDADLRELTVNWNADRPPSQMVITMGDHVPGASSGGGAGAADGGAAAAAAADTGPGGGAGGAGAAGVSSVGGSTSSKSTRGVFANTDEDDAICFFLEKLNHQTKLEYLSLKGSNLSYSADLVLCESLSQAKNLTQFDASDNPHGKDGVRCLLRLLVSPECGISNLDLANVRSRYYAPGESSRYSFTDPNGTYVLRMDMPSDRAVLKLLHRCAWYFKTKEASFEEMSLDGSNCGLPIAEKSSDRGRVYEFAAPKGRLKFRFVLDDKPFQDAQKKLKGGGGNAEEHSLMSPRKDGAPIGGHPTSLLEYSKLKATLLRFVPLAVVYQALQSDREKSILLEGMAFDVRFKLCHVQYFIEKAPLLTQFIVKTLYPTVHRSEAMQLVNLLPHPSLQRAVRQATSNAMFFNIENPTGRYSLLVENPTDRNMAETLLRLSHWERGIQEEHEEEILDTSQYGDRSCLRNIVLNGNPFRTAEITSDTLQSATGLLEVDYRTRLFTEQGKFDSANNKQESFPYTHALIWSQLMDKLFESEISNLGKVRCFRQISHQLSLHAKQVKEFITFFARAKPAPRSDGQPVLPFNWYSNDQRSLDEIENASVRTVGGLFLDSDRVSHLRSDAFLALWARLRAPNSAIMTNTGEFRTIPDEDDDGLLYDPHLFCLAEQKSLVSALGWITCIDVKRICDPNSNFGGFFSLDLGIYEEWTIARIIISLAAQEDGDNLLNPHWTGAKQTAFGGFHVPITWIEELPDFGVFSCQYCHEEPQFINMEARFELMRQFLADGELLEPFRRNDEGKKLVPPADA
eukprot:CAMPEP_0179000520 /NCGR_PEP_ID=MMETSP0795-20121207/10731_1 /TAXON_ID=88552 /ORGANISM="Amoebophrya sp., Strain Ameob2" /LENGTH=1463 /DNA_ID=CAMNT_0020693553 /DNA_START=348 /DNA_END=4740 /DNA_ORIENTATION=+